MARYEDLTVGKLRVQNGIKGNAGESLLGSQQAAVANAVANHTVTVTFSNTEVKGHLDALGAKVNSILAALRAHGIIAT